ncbi:hypothetical protein ACI7RC_18735 [Brevibacillus sp. B_LB10_24]|uniref:hypothetical protein n=1 Tax=Brevibacillus sp. B_LB10_24 TaxID=3380645 RepID=UPI0038BB81B2
MRSRRKADKKAKVRMVSSFSPYYGPQAVSPYFGKPCPPVVSPFQTTRPYCPPVVSPYHAAKPYCPPVVSPFQAVKPFPTPPVVSPFAKPPVVSPFARPPFIPPFVQPFSVCDPCCANCTRCMTTGNNSACRYCRRHCGWNKK